MPSPQQEASESQLRAMEVRQKIFDAYFITFNCEAGKIVLANMRERAFFKKSTFEGDGRDRGIRDAREGQRNFHLVTEDFIEKGKSGARPPSQAQAISNTAEPRNET